MGMRKYSTNNMNRTEQNKYWNVLCDLQGNIEDIENERTRLLENIKYPSSLFRFRSVSNNSLMALQNNELYFSSADYYDDPFDTYLRMDIGHLENDIKALKQNIEFVVEKVKESFPNFTITENDIVNLCKSSTNKSDVINQVQQLRSVFQRYIYSICFCEEFQNEVLWLKYAENHTGFVLEYTLNKSILKDIWESKLHANILPIYYSNKKYDAYHYAIYYLTLNMVRGNPEIYDKLQWMYPIGWENTKMSIIKKSCHKYDKEWRIVPLYVLNQREFISWKPKSVTIGLRTPNYKKQLIISAAKLAGIPEYYEMYIDNNDNFKRRKINV